MEVLSKDVFHKVRELLGNDLTNEEVTQVLKMRKNTLDTLQKRIPQIKKEVSALDERDLNAPDTEVSKDIYAICLSRGGVIPLTAISTV